MATWGRWLATRRQGALEAQRTRINLGLVAERRLDIFDVIDRTGIWLMFQPLDRLYGFYRRVGDVAGIAVNSNHPLALQRYTAAHEFGHHVLGHAFGLDEVRNVDGARGIPEAADLENTLGRRSGVDLGDPDREAAAQAFAATLLMPLHIMNQLLVERGFDRDHPELDAPHVYALSLELGTSYEATVTQLAVLDKVSWAQARSFRIPPIRIKTRVAGRRPTDSRAEVWLIEETMGERQLHLRPGDEIALRLPEVPSSGYTWVLATREYVSLEVLDDEIRALSSDADLIGGPALREILFRASQLGSDRLELHLQRPWEADAPPVQSVSVHVTVESGPTGEAPSGLVHRQQVQRALAGV